MQTDTVRKKATPKNEWRWFIEPLNAHTNEVIAAMFPQRGENAMRLRDALGHEHNVWECTHEEAYKLRMSVTKGLRFLVFMKYNGNPLELCQQPFKRFAKKRRRR